MARFRAGYVNREEKLIAGRASRHELRAARQFRGLVVLNVLGL